MGSKGGISVTQKLSPDAKKSKNQYINRYNTQMYEAFKARFPKGEKEKYRKYAESHRFSLNGLVLAALQEYVERHP